jgi:hypothetical protein
MSRGQARASRWGECLIDVEGGGERDLERAAGLLGRVGLVEDQEARGRAPV